LSLDDTIGKWLPQLPAQWAPVTLAQLLGHTSGISDYTESKAFVDAFLASLLVAPPPVYLLSYAAADLRFTPGSRYEYSNSDNIIVGRMVEAATGRTYESTLKRDVFGPLKLRRTSLPASAKMPRPFIHGYDIDPALPPDDVSEIAAPGWAWASGGMVST